MLILVVTFLAVALAKPVYEHSKSNVMPLTNFNFNDQISKIRQTTNYVSIVHFYKHADGKSLAFAPDFDKWTDEYRGVFRICAVDCDTYAELCRKEDITEFPTIKLYAPIPIPPTKYAVPPSLMQG